MTALRNDLPAVLRRRARELAGEYAPEWVMPLQRAADELEVRQRCSSPECAEQEAVDRAAENVRYRRALDELFAAIHGSTMERSRRERCEEIIKRCQSYGGKRPKRQVIAIEIKPGFTREDLLASFARQLQDMDFGGTHVEESEEEGDEEAAQPIGAGRHADQHPGAEEAEPGAEGTGADLGGARAADAAETAGDSGAERSEP